MTDEQAFLVQINAQPEDRTVRLIYADWLEERGDPRAEVVRIEEEMRRVPIYSDRYWELKPRRNKARQRCRADWLEEMSYGTEYEPVFHKVPSGWKARWRLVREFTERWYGIPMGDVGLHGVRTRETEKGLGFSLPPSFREWIAYSRDLRSQSRFYILRDSYDVRELRDLGALSLMLQGEGDVYWAVRKQNLKLTDPPVEEYTLDYEDEENDEASRFVHRGPAAPHLSGYVFSHLGACLQNGAGGFGVSVRPTNKLLRQLSDAFPVRSCFDNVEVFERRNLIVMLNHALQRGAERHLQVAAWKTMLPEQVPECVWALAQGGGWFQGMFVPRDEHST